MASVSAPGGRGSGKKLLNIDLNLVPFIDLLTCLICFLLMAAVWIQIGRITVSPPAVGHGTGGPTPDLPDLVVAITPQGFLVTSNGLVIADIGKRAGAFDFKALGGKLGELRQQYRGEHALVVMSHDEIPYQTLVDTMDVCLSNDFALISVAALI